MAKAEILNLLENKKTRKKSLPILTILKMQILQKLKIKLQKMMKFMNILQKFAKNQQIKLFTQTP